MVMKPLLRSFFIALFLSSLTLSGKFGLQRQLAGNDQSPFMQLQFTTIQEVCQDHIITNFFGWYNVWVPRYLWETKKAPASIQNKEMTASVDDHIDKVSEHLAKLKAEKKKIEQFPTLFLKAKISRIDSQANLFINKDVPNAFEDPKQLQAVAEETQQPHLPDLVSHFNSFPVTDDLIDINAHSYKHDWDRKTENTKPLTKVVEELSKPLIVTLKHILRIHTQVQEEEYKAIQELNKPLIQSFWDGFKFLLGPDEKIKDDIRNALIVTGKAPVPQQTFFTPEFFTELKSHNSPFNPELNREEFLTLDGPKENLEQIRELAKPLFFSSDFPQVFTADPRYFDPHFVPTGDKLHNKKEKKKADLHRLLYIVYLFARLDNTLPHNTPATPVEILKALKDWVKNNNDFDDSPEDLSNDLLTPEEIIAQKPVEQPKKTHKPLTPSSMHALIPISVFKKNYLELIALICEKLGENCNADELLNDPVLLDKVAKYGNYEDIMKDDKSDSNLPTGYPEKVAANLKKKNIDDVALLLDKQMEELFPDDLYPDDFDEESDIEDPHNGELFHDEVVELIKPDDAVEEEEQEEDIPEEIIPVEDLTPEQKTELKKNPTKRFTRKPAKKPVRKPKVDLFKPTIGEIESKKQPEVKDISPDTLKVTPKSPRKRPTRSGKPRTDGLSSNFPRFSPTKDDFDEKGQPIVLDPKAKDIVPNEKHLRERKAKLNDIGSPKKNKKFEEIMNRFLPTEGGITEPGKLFVDDFTKKADTSTPEKAIALKNVLIEFLLKKIEDNQKKPTKTVTDVINRINKKETDALLNPITPASSEGLRNFFMMTVTEPSLRFLAMNHDEENFYRHDLIMFVAMHDTQEMQKIATQAKQSSNPQAYLAQHKPTLAAFTRETEIAVKYLTNQQNKVLKAVEVNAAYLAERNKLLNENVRLARYMPAYRLFAQLIDFFDYFKISKEAKAEYANYRRVFLNFYSFIVSLRRSVDKDITNVHAYVLSELEICLHYTSVLDNIITEEASAVCKLSHRKYAEMNYFYKLYLIKTGKVQIDQLAPLCASFDTNLAPVLNFAFEIPAYKQTLDEYCRTSNEAVCKSWVYYKVIINWLLHPEVAATEQELKDTFATENPKATSYLFAVLNALDAAETAIKRGNTKDYSKFGLLTQKLQEYGIRFRDLENEHVHPLALYLKRSYKRLFFTVNEAIANQIVAAVLAGEQSSNHSFDSFEQVVSINGRYLPENLSFFLQLATTSQQFERIARFIIQSGAGDRVLQMRSEENLSVYREIVQQVAKVQTTSNGSNDEIELAKARLDLIRNSLHHRINEFSQLCIDVFRSELSAEPLEQDEFDLTELLMNAEEDDRMDDQEHADNAWVSEVETKVVTLVSKQPIQTTYEQIIESVQVDEKSPLQFNFDLQKPDSIQFELSETNQGVQWDEINPNMLTKMIINGRELNPNEIEMALNQIKAMKDKMTIEKVADVVKETDNKLI